MDVTSGNNVLVVVNLQNNVSNVGGVVGPIITGATVGTTGSSVLVLMFSAALIDLVILDYLFLLGKVEPISFESTPEIHHSYDQRNADAHVQPAEQSQGRAGR